MKRRALLGVVPGSVGLGGCVTTMLRSRDPDPIHFVYAGLKNLDDEDHEFEIEVESGDETVFDDTLVVEPNWKPNEDELEMDYPLTTRPVTIRTAVDGWDIEHSFNQSNTCVSTRIIYEPGNTDLFDEPYPLYYKPLIGLGPQYGPRDRCPREELQER